MKPQSTFSPLWITAPSHRLDESRVAALEGQVIEAGHIVSKALRGEAGR